MISLENMEDPLSWKLVGAPACAELGGTAGGDFERIAIGAQNVEQAAGRGALGALLDPRVPGSAAVAHARQARALIDPALEACRLAGVDGRHLPLRVLRAVDVYAIAARRRDGRRDDRLHADALADPGGDRGAERRQREHQQVER